MKNRVVALVALYVGLPLALLSLWSYFDVEPKYDGRPLSYWLDQNATGEFQDGIEETLKALRTIGAPAAGPLVEDLACTDSTFRRYYTGLRSMLPASINTILPRQRMEAPDLRNNAFSALCHIQSEAREQVPELIQLLQHQDKKVRIYAILVLGLIGADAKPAVPLLEELTAHQKLAGYASGAIRRINNDCEIVQSGVQEQAVKSAQPIGRAEPPPSVPIKVTPHED